MTTPHHIPDIVIGRLPFYLRTLDQLAQQGHEITSSHELGQRLGLSSAQIRKDLSYFGEFGKQGMGYQITHLQTQLRHILHINHEWSMIVVGAGQLGRALINYHGFVERGFRIVSVFDNDLATIDTLVNNIRITDISELENTLHKGNIKIAMLAVPAENAQQVCDQLVKAGVRSILNYAPTSLVAPANVHIEYIDPVTHLQRMTYYLGEINLTKSNTGS